MDVSAEANPMLRVVHTAAALVLLACSIGTGAEDKVLFMELSPTVIPADVGASAFAMVGSFVEGGAFSWMPTSGTRNIGGRSAVAVSLDGATIIGRALDARGLENAAIWKGGAEWRLLGSFTPSAQPCDQLLSGSFGASDDGRVIVGLGWDSCRYAHAFRWEETTGMIDLGSTTAGSSRANDVSGNGQVVVGWQEAAVGFRQGAKWVNLRQELIRGPSGVVGEAFAANRDGSLIVGTGCEPGNPLVSSAWAWTADAGVRCFPVNRPSSLPALPYLTSMLATSDNGRVIGGAFHFGLNSEALLWLDGQGHFLTEYLRSNGYPDAFRGWVNSGFVTGVSPDGRTIVGYGAGPTTFQGYMVVLPEHRAK
jgi:probable HAF family extracellular repeat protein